ncbi:MAG: sensor histidine kinase [Deltaproteobacteria bacterium]|nr:MAG: sensor histidine kinase [Deltaproteobacteria bacterium]
MPGAGTKGQAGRSRWRHTLYARAWLFLLLGGGALVGALGAMSGRLVDASVDRLLDERLDLARTVGGLVERRLLGELEHLRHRAAMFFGPEQREQLRRALGREYPVTLFHEGAFTLTADGTPDVVLPSGPSQLEEAIDLRGLAARAQALGRPVISPLVHLRVGDRPVLVAVQAVTGPKGVVTGYVGGVVQPTATDLLRDVAEIRGSAVTDLELVDANGIVVASTARTDLYESGDHESVLVDAIARRRDFKGRCHSCHEEDDEEPADTHVMSFAPLPTLSLGLAVYQPERAALAPAFDLRRQLVMVIAVVAIFVVFLGFAVNSVVRPVVRLRRAVDRLETGADRSLPAFGRDEVGTLARSLEQWRGRMVDAMSALDDARRAASAEAEAVRRHLEALEGLAARSAGGADVETLLDAGLQHLLATTGLDQGAVRLMWGERQYIALVGLSEDRVPRLLREAEELTLNHHVGGQGGPGSCAVAAREGTGGEGHRVLARLRAQHGSSVTAVMCGNTQPTVREHRIHSLLFHLCMTTSGRILRDREQLVQRQQERYLRGLLDAQEEERARIARDLHDTIAQDLAALRLDLERLALRAPEGDPRTHVEELEQRASDALRTTRAILLDLRLTVLQSMGFVATLQWHLERIGREHGIRGTLSLDGDERPLGYVLNVALLRIFQECLNNVVQHARAEQVFVTLAFEPDHVTLVVEDDGVGFDEASAVRAGADERGLGLLGMRERTRLLGGTLTITSRPGEGTSVTVTVPNGAFDEAPPADAEERPA